MLMPVEEYNYITMIHEYWLLYLFRACLSHELVWTLGTCPGAVIKFGSNVHSGHGEGITNISKPTFLLFMPIMQDLDFVYSAAI